MKKQVQIPHIKKTDIYRRLYCKLCSQSKNWLGKYSPIPRIKGGKLWLSQHLDSVGLTDSDQTYILEAITRIKENAAVDQAY